MSRINLDVPYNERKQARQLGARWDAHCHCWYVPDGVDPSALLGWSRASLDVNARAHHYYVLETVQVCEQCWRPSRVHGVVLPTGHEVRLQADEGEDEWERSDEPSLISFVTSLAPSVSARLRSQTYCYQLRYRLGDPVSYHTNHCEHCATAFDEYTLFATPGRGFDVLSEFEAAEITVTVIPEGFAGMAEHFSYGVTFLNAMTRR
jgi:hypothetical protein